LTHQESRFACPEAAILTSFGTETGTGMVTLGSMATGIPNLTAIATKNSAKESVDYDHYIYRYR
jgi:hypothetical protein